MRGALKEIYPSDFEEGVTTLPAYGPMTNRYSFTYMELPDTITTIGDRYFDDGGTDACLHIFPKNIKSVGCNCTWNESNPTKTRIADFSKAISVPSISHSARENTSSSSPPIDTSFSNYTVIKVPSSLYNTWRATEGWNHEDLVSRIVRA
jgi:hypothetical protein